MMLKFISLHSSGCPEPSHPEAKIPKNIFQIFKCFTIGYGCFFVCVFFFLCMVLKCPSSLCVFVYVRIYICFCLFVFVYSMDEQFIANLYALNAGIKTDRKFYINFSNIFFKTVTHDCKVCQDIGINDSIDNFITIFNY